MSNDQIHHWGTKIGLTLEEHTFHRRSSTGARTMPRPGVALDAPAAEAFVNHGRWIALCPQGDGGAEYIDPTRPTFFCCECRNVATDHLPIPVRIPANAAEIEEHLLKRPDPKTRNWLVGETVEDLHRENVEHEHVEESAA